MICPNCGAKIENEKVRFCPECGEELGKEPQQAHSGSKAPQQTYGTAQEQPPQAGQGTAQSMKPPKAPRKPMSRAQKILAAECALLLGSCVLLYTQDKALNDPDKVVERYMDAMMEQDYRGMHSCLDLGGSPFLSEAVYQNVMMTTQTAVPSEIQNYRIQERADDGKADFFTKIYNVEFTGKGDDTSGLAPLELKAKRSFFLSDWKISMPLMQDMMFHVWPGLTVKLDQVELSNANAKVRFGSETDMYYIIPEMFYGTHTVEVSRPGFAPYSETIEVPGEEDGSVSLPTPNLAEETLQSLSEQAGQDWCTLITAAVNGVPVKPPFRQDLEQAQQSLFRPDPYDSDSMNHATSVDMGSIEIELIHIRILSKSIFVELKARTDLVVNGDHREEIVVDGDPAIRITSPQTVTGIWEMNLGYSLDNGAWTLEYGDMYGSYPFERTYNPESERIVKKS